MSKCEYKYIGDTMEIKPTKMTTFILTTIINERPEAFALIDSEKDIYGTVCFYPFQNGTIMVYEINGLPKGEKGIFGFHIHEGDTCLNDTAVPYEKTKGHFNPTNHEHPYHLGDLPPLFATRGKAWSIVYIDKFKPEQIIGRTMIVHVNPDDFHTQPSGNSGEKIACGEIKRFQ